MICFLQSMQKLMTVCLIWEDPMNLKHLEYFIAVVQEGTISAAARRLHISQPPLSTAIHQLEQELKTTLFYRGSRQITLTESGRFLYQRACTILDFCNQTCQTIEDLSRGLSGTLKIGLASSVHDFFLDEYALSFHKKYPDIYFELTEATTYELLEMLDSNTIEAAFVRTPFPSTEFDCIRLCSEPIVAFGYEHFFPKQAKDTLKLSMLSNAPLILYRRWLTVLKKEFQRLSMTPNILCINDDARTTVQWAMKGMGIGIIPKSAADSVKSTKMKSLALFTKKQFSSDIICIFSTAQYRSNALQQFYDFMHTKSR